MTGLGPSAETKLPKLTILAIVTPSSPSGVAVVVVVYSSKIFSQGAFIMIIGIKCTC